MPKKTIGEKLRELRGEKSREDVANALHISAAAIGMYETNQRIPRDTIKEAIAKYYGQTVGAIFFDE